MTVKETIKILSDYEELSCGFCHCGGDEVPQAFEMAVKALEAWEKVIDAVNNLDEHDYCRCEGANIPPMIDKEDVLTIIKMNLCEVENEQTKR